MQSDEEYIGISLSSGSSRGVYQLGALHAADISEKCNNVKYFAGTSVGSIIALLLAVGWKPLELFSYICIHDFTQVYSLQFDIPTAIKKWGAIDITPLREYISKLVIQKAGGIPTFKTLANEGKYFIATAYKLKSKEPNVYFSVDTHPNMSVVDAVLLSSSIPFVFQAQNYDGDYYIDGGCFDLCPSAFLHTYIQTHEKTSTHKKVLSVTLDLRQSSDEEQEVISDFMDYLKELVFVVMYNQKPLQSIEAIDTLQLSTEVNDNLHLQIDKQTKIKWFCSGVQQGLEYFTPKK